MRFMVFAAMIIFFGALVSVPRGSAEPPSIEIG